jgi:hypothetical protein
MGATVSQWHTVVHQSGGHTLASGQARFAQRMGREISNTNAPPRFTVANSSGRVALALLIAPGFLLRMGGAEAVVG